MRLTAQSEIGRIRSLLLKTPSAAFFLAFAAVLLRAGGSHAQNLEVAASDESSRFKERLRGPTGGIRACWRICHCFVCAGPPMTNAIEPIIKGGDKRMSDEWSVYRKYTT